MWALLDRFRRDASGVTAIEYGLIGALIAVVIVAGTRRLGTTLGAKFSAIASAVGSAVTVP